jgi:hypothetical protein
MKIDLNCMSDFLSESNLIGDTIYYANQFIALNCLSDFRYFNSIGTIIFSYRKLFILI